MNLAQMTEPIVLEIDPQTWTQHLDRVEKWLGNVLMVQTTYRQLVESTAGKIEEPHIREYLRGLAEGAKDHEQKAEELYRLIGRDPSTGRKFAGSVMTVVQQAMGGLQGMMGGAAGGGWRQMRQLLLVNMDAIGAFAMAEQLALSLGLHKMAEIAFNVVNEKTAHQLLIQEYMLEMGPIAILYQENP